MQNTDQQLLGFYYEKSNINALKKLAKKKKTDVPTLIKSALKKCYKLDFEVSEGN